jgi:acetyltransferase-like isoleucine patch superfamily enzyme
MKINKLLKAMANFIGSLSLLFVTHLPSGPGNRLRYWYYKRKLKYCGNGVVIDTGTVIEGCSLVSIGNNVHIDKSCLLTTGSVLQGKIFRKDYKDWMVPANEIIIEDDVHIVNHCMIVGFGGVLIKRNSTLSAGTKIYSLSNLPADPDCPEKVVSIMPYSQAPFILSPVLLEQNVWLGLNCIVMPGTKVNKNSFAVSNSLLLGEYEENSHLAGQPASKVKKRYQY